MASGRIAMCVRDIITNAKRQGWDAARMQPVFPNLPRDTLQKLLDGSAVVTEEDGYGGFTVYVPDVVKQGVQA